MTMQFQELLDKYYESYMRERFEQAVISFDQRDIIEEKIEKIYFKIEYKMKQRIDSLELKLESLSKNMDALYHELQSLKRGD